MPRLQGLPCPQGGPVGSRVYWRSNEYGQRMSGTNKRMRLTVAPKPILVRGEKIVNGLLAIPQRRPGVEFAHKISMDSGGEVDKTRNGQPRTIESAIVSLVVPKTRRPAPGHRTQNPSWKALLPDYRLERRDYLLQDDSRIHHLDTLPLLIDQDRIGVGLGDFIT